MSKRTGFNMATVNDYRDDDYGDYDREYDKNGGYGEEDYYNEMTEEEQIAAAKKASNKMAKEEKKSKFGGFN
jgi:hypothetical protein